MNFDNFFNNNDTINFFKKIKEKGKKLPNILLTGESCSGKTFLINIIIKEFNITEDRILKLDLYNIDKNDFKKSKIYTFIKKIINNYGIIIIDNYNEISLEDQFLIKSLIKNYQKNNVFILSLNNTNNLYKNFLQYFVNIHLNLPTKSELSYFIKKNNYNLNNEQIEIILDNITNFNQLKMFDNKIKLYSDKDISNTDLDLLINNDKYILINIISYIQNKNIDLLVKYIDTLLYNYNVKDIFLILFNNIYKVDNINDNYKQEYLKNITYYIINNYYTYTQLISLFIKMSQINCK